MRKFSSYGPIDTEEHYYAPRTKLIERTYQQLLGENLAKSGHYLTIWAPRQTGKTWITNQVLYRLHKEVPQFDVVKLNLQDLEDVTVAGIYQSIIDKLRLTLNVELPAAETQQAFAACFSNTNLKKPLILMLDEFDALQEEAIRGLVNVFRNIYLHRQQEIDRPTDAKTYLLHSVALIGVRSVLGVENTSGSPFNIQRSVQIPNLSQAEVTKMFEWYSEESGQSIDSGVLERIYQEMKGQPGLTCWLGELLTETYKVTHPRIQMKDFEAVYGAALNIPNNNILNILSKAKQDLYKPLVLKVFETTAKIPFRFGDPQTNFLYLNGVVDQEIVSPAERYLKFRGLPFQSLYVFISTGYNLWRPDTS